MSFQLVWTTPFAHWKAPVETRPQNLKAAREDEDEVGQEVGVADLKVEEGSPRQELLQKQRRQLQQKQGLRRDRLRHLRLMDSHSNLQTRTNDHLAVEIDCSYHPRRPNRHLPNFEKLRTRSTSDNAENSICHLMKFTIFIDLI